MSLNTNVKLYTSNAKSRRIGIMGGTFDPVHFGHLFIAQTALHKFNLNKVLFIPTGQPPHKRNNIITDSNKRVDMIKLAIKSNPNFEVSTVEIDRKKTSYTIDTVRELQRCHSKETQFYFIMGSDAFKYIETWKDYKELLKIIKLIVMTRGTSKNNFLNNKIKSITKKYNGQITKVQIPLLDISSTNIRTRIKEGNSIKYLLPENVEKYILDNKLYID